MTTLLTFAARLALIASLIGFSLISTPDLSYACSCVQPGTPSEELEKSAAVFAGRVVSIREFERGDGRWSSMDPTTVEFHVNTVWKGPEYETMRLTTARMEGSCGFTFVEGSEYLVYSRDATTVSLCSRTRSLSEAEEDLTELGEGRGSTPGSATPVTPSGGGCNVGTSISYVWMIGLVAGAVWFGVRKRSCDRDS